MTPGHTGPETGTYWTFSRKKCNGNVTKQKIPYITFKKEQTSKKAKTKQNKCLVSISNVGDQLWLVLVLTFRSS